MGSGYGEVTLHTHPKMNGLNFKREVCVYIDVHPICICMQLNVYRVCYYSYYD